ncbi:KAP family NTPase [Curtobacterium flaccumfaciens pv. betae]|nr:KAP family NTPase [Curtobacterium flaccumfaciens pv. betae]
MRLNVAVMTDAIWNDDALEASDIPGRADFAAAMAQRIDHVQPGRNSAVFGLVGSWGTGKSTLLSEMRTHLSNRGWTVVEFSPWSAADVNSITAEFISTLAGAFPDKKGKVLRRSLAKYARFGVPALSAIPIAGRSAEKIADAALTYAASQPAWHVTFDQISKEVARQEKRVLVIVDDVDRLDYEELRTVLRVVRLLGRFQNVHYLLAYDQVTIDRNLHAGNSEGSSSEFMEKIVQHPFEVPPVPMVTRRSWCRAIVDAHPGVAVSDNLDNYYLEQKEDLIRLLADGIETPRSARRLKEQLDSMAPLAAEAEIDALDFIALTWLRLMQHAVWEDIRTHSDRYLGWSENDPSELPDPRMEHLPHIVMRGQSVVVARVLQFLFVRTTAGGLAGRKWRLHHERYFHRYFVVALTDADVSERLVELALAEAVAGATAMPEMNKLRAIMVSGDGERGALAIELLATARKDADTTTRPLIAFIGRLRADILTIGRDRFSRLSTVDRWLALEAERAIRLRAISASEFIDEFGYRQLVRAGYATRRLYKDDFESVRTPYDRAVALWVEQVQRDGMGGIGESDDVAVMTAFAHALDDAAHRGYLADLVGDVHDLVQIAELFVDLDRWVGSDVHYEISFHTNEFRFAVGDAINSFTAESLPPVTDLPSYEVDDRLTPDLTSAERRDYAVRRLMGILAD